MDTQGKNQTQSVVYSYPTIDKKNLPSLKQAMADVEAASGTLYSAKYILQLVICQQEEALQMAKTMMKSLE